METAALSEWIRGHDGVTYVASHERADGTWLRIGGRYTKDGRVFRCEDEIKATLANARLVLGY